MINNKVILPDVSFYQDAPDTPQMINFVKMKSNGANGVIIRVGQNTWIDEDFAYNYRESKAAGLPRGVYWFYDSRSSPESQADKFLSLVGNDLPELGFWGDYEETYGGAYRGQANFRTFMDRVKTARPSSVVGIYTAYYYWLENTTVTGRQYFIKFPLWIANYQVTSPAIPSPWTNYIFWQYTTKGDGIAFGCESKDLDLNYFYSDYETYKTYFGLGGTTPPPNNGGNMIYKGTVTASALNVRPMPNTTNTPYFSLLRDTLVEADRIEGGWWHLTYIEGKFLETDKQYWAYEGSLQEYIRLDEVVEPPQEPSLPASFDITMDAVDENGNILKTYKGTVS